MNQTLSLAREYLDVEVKTVTTGTVTIATRVVETDEVVAPSLQRDDVELDRITVNRVVEQILPPRQEGDVTIVPVYEEVLVVTKQLILKEELHIRRRSSTLPPQPQTYTLRREELTITRTPAVASE